MLPPPPLPALRRDFPGGERLADDPLIHVLDGVLAPAECERLIALARPLLRRAQVSGAVAGATSPGRTSERAWLAHQVDPLVHEIAERIAALVGLPLDHAEPLQVLRYGPGQEYRPHYDAYDLTTDKGRLYTARGGQRLVTALVYLGDVAGGGATAFPRLGLAVTPRRGRLLLFHNCRPGTDALDPRTSHQGLPPARGDKWAFNLWFHARAYQREARPT